MAPQKLEASDIIFNIFSYFKREKERGKLYLSVDKLWERTIAATGVSKSTVYNTVLAKEKQLCSSSVEMQVDGASSDEPLLDSLSMRPACRALDKFNQDLVRGTVYALHSERVPPTLGKIQDRIKDSIEISKSKLAIALNQIGFSFRNRGNKHYVKENQQILSDRCNYLRLLREYRQTGFQVVYLDETWVNQNHKSDYGWYPGDESELPLYPAGKGARYVVLHAGCREKGLLPGCDLVFKAQSGEGDYHKEMNGVVFLGWWVHQLLPALDEPSVIVIDNASYHNVRMEETIAPTSNSRKQAMIDWLNARSIPFPPLSKCIDLLNIIKARKPKPVYKTDVLAGQHGHFVLRLPVRHCELNPIELIWANCKNFVARNNSTFKMADVKVLINSAFGRITPDVWARCEDHVMKIEENYWKTDLVAESTIQPVVINLAESDSDSQESDSD